MAQVKIFTRQEMYAYWLTHPEAVFTNTSNHSFIAQMVNKKPVITISESANPAASSEFVDNWVLTTAGIPKSTKDVVYSKSKFEIRHPLLSLEYGWKYADKIMTPDQFVSLVLSIRYPTDQLADILDNAMWYEIADN